MPGSPLKTYKRWIASFAVFGLVVWLVPADLTCFGTYPKLCLAGVVIGVASILVYTLVLSAIDIHETKVAFSMVRDYIRKK